MTHRKEINQNKSLIHPFFQKLRWPWYPAIYRMIEYVSDEQSDPNKNWQILEGRDQLMVPM